MTPQEELSEHFGGVPPTDNEMLARAPFKLLSSFEKWVGGQRGTLNMKILFIKLIQITLCYKDNKYIIMAVTFATLIPIGSRSQTSNFS